jgi:hypothetical protein
MDLLGYLENSREQRQSTIRLADDYLNRTSRKLSENFLQSLVGPCPQRFQIFKSQVNEDLKKIFNPAAPQRYLKTPGSVSENRRKKVFKMYSGGFQSLHKKQKVLIPYENLSYRSKIIEKLGKSVDKASAPTLPDKILKKPQNTIKLSQKEIKNKLLLPVLTTTLPHEERCKIYKYK